MAKVGKAIEVLLGIFQSGKDKLSCKRVCGLVGWLTILYCATHNIEISYMEMLIGATVVLLGVETVTDIFKKNGDKN